MLRIQLLAIAVPAVLEAAERKIMSRGKSQQTVKRALVLCVEAMTLGPRGAKLYCKDELVNLFKAADLITESKDINFSERNFLSSLSQTIDKMSLGWIHAIPVGNGKIVLVNTFVSEGATKRKRPADKSTWNTCSSYEMRLAYARKQAKILIGG